MVKKTKKKDISPRKVEKYLTEPSSKRKRGKRAKKVAEKLLRVTDYKKGQRSRVGLDPHLKKHVMSFLKPTEHHNDIAKTVLTKTGRKPKITKEQQIARKSEMKEKAKPRIRLNQMYPEHFIHEKRNWWHRK